MHEMSIAQSLFEIIEEQIRIHDLSRVTAVRLKVGELSDVVPEALEFSFEVLARGTPVEDAALEITVVPLSARCGACGNEFRVERFCYDCPACGSDDAVPIAGQELCLEQLEGE